MWIMKMLNDNQKGIEVKVNENGVYEWVKDATDDAEDISDSDES